jgi:hypothetical protein
MKKLLSKRLIPFFLVSAFSLSLFDSTKPFPANSCPFLIIFSYAVITELIIYFLPRQRIIRLWTIWLFAIMVPPVWTFNGIILLYGSKPPIASADVLLPMLWMFITVVIYTFSISVSLRETFQRKN